MKEEHGENLVRWLAKELHKQTAMQAIAQTIGNGMLGESFESHRDRIICELGFDRGYRVGFCIGPHRMREEEIDHIVGTYVRLFIRNAPQADTDGEDIEIDAADGWLYGLGVRQGLKATRQK